MKTATATATKPARVLDESTLDLPPLPAVQKPKADPGLDQVPEECIEPEVEPDPREPQPESGSPPEEELTLGMPGDGRDQESDPNAAE